MKQLTLTKKQQNLLAQMNDMFKKAHEEDIDFIYDIDDESLTAFNSANVSDFYVGREGCKEEEDDEEINFDICYHVDNASIGCVDYERQKYYLKFK